MRGIVLICVCMGLLMGCSDNKASQDNNPNPPAETPAEKAKKLKAMPLHQALRTKYTQVLFTCDYGFSVTRPAADGSHSYSHQEGLLVWDVLRDYTKERWFDFDYDFENVESNFQFKMNLSLEDITTTRRDKSGEGEQAVVLRNAITASGEVQMRIFEKSLDGRSVELEIGRGPEAKVFHDRVPREMIVTSFGPAEDPRRHTSISVTCQLDTQVKPEYESDFQVIQ